MFSADLGGYTAPLPAATDPPFQKVALLLHGDGTNGAQNNTFVDSSTNNFTITRTGNVAQGTFSPFSLAEGQWSNYFDGSGDYLSIAETRSLDLGGANFCVEAFVYYTSLTGAQAFLCQDNADYQLNCYKDSGNTLWLYSYAPSYNFAISLGTVAANQWYHVVCCRTGNTVAGFLNGVRKNTASFSGTIGTGSPGGWSIGKGYSTNDPLSGYVSNVRFVIGSNPYDATQTTLTVPTAPLTAISGTSLLTCQSNRFKDNSSNNFTITPAGDTKVTAFSPFAPSAAYSASTNGGSGYFDGSGDYLSAAYGSGFNLSTNNFTIEGWFYFSSVASGQQILTGYSNVSTNRNFAFYMPSSGTVSYYLSSNGTSWDIASGVTIGTVTTNTWYHIALVRNGSTFTPYINGISGTTATSSSAIYNGSSPIIIGADPSGSSNYTGYASNLRLVNGTAIYTANFTPPTAPLTAVTNTQLLLNCTNAGIYDNAGKNNIETVGNAQISTSVKKYGTGSMYFDGTGDYLTTPYTPTLNFGTDNFTIEGWFYFNSVASGQQPVSGYTTINNENYAFYMTSTGGLAYYLSSTGNSWNIASNVSMGTVTTSTWYHIALVRNGSTFTPYINGVAGTTSSSSSAIYNSGTGITLGAFSGAFFFNGYIDDFRITKGQALYTSNFTPPTQAFPNV